MRVKQLLNYIPFKKSISLLYARATLTPFTTAYFIVAIAHCVIQVVIQSIAFSENTELASSITNVIREANVPIRLTNFLGNGSLEVCDNVPSTDPGSCHVVSPMSAVIMDAQNTTQSNYSSYTSISSASISSQSSTALSSLYSTPSQSASVNSSSPTTFGPSATLAGVPLSAFTNVPTANGSQSGLSSRSITKRSAVVQREYNLHVRDLSAQPQYDSNGNLQDVLISGVDGQSVTVPLSCVEALSWPYEYFRDANRSDLVLLLFQFWLLTVSVVAILNESIPHLVVALAGHSLSTGWGAYLLVRTMWFRARFNNVITQGACGGINLLPDLWHGQIAYVIPSLAVDGAVLPIMAYLEWKLFKVYNWQTFKRVGASEAVNRVYKLVLLFSVFLQLSAFFTLISTALWVDELITGIIGQFEKYKTGSEALFIFICIAQLPWLIMGWRAIRTENKSIMIIFFMMGGIVIAAWGVMFASAMYRMVFLEWPFFAALTCTSFAFLGATLVLAVICFLNFGHGLAHYLKMQEAMAEARFTPVYIPNGSRQREVNVEKGAHNEADVSGLEDVKNVSISVPEATAKPPGRTIYPANEPPPSPTESLRFYEFPTLNKDGLKSTSSLPGKAAGKSTPRTSLDEQSSGNRSDSRTRRMLSNVSRSKAVPPPPVYVAQNAPALGAILSPARFSSRFSKSTAAAEAALSASSSRPASQSSADVDVNKAMPPLPPPKDRDSGYFPTVPLVSSRLSQSTSNLTNLTRSNSARSIVRQESPGPFGRLGRSTSTVRLSNYSVSGATGLPSNPRMHK